MSIESQYIHKHMPNIFFFFEYVNPVALMPCFLDK